MNDQQINSYRKAPKQIREILASPYFFPYIKNISKKNSLDNKQESIVEKLVSDVLVGIIAKENIAENLKEISVDGVKNKKIKEDIENDILKKLSEIYKSIQEKYREEDIKNGVEFYEIEEFVEEWPKPTEKIKLTEQTPISLWIQNVYNKNLVLVNHDIKEITASINKAILEKRDGGNKNSYIIPENIKNLPSNIQKIIIDGVWKDKTIEISKKYSLSTEQENSFINFIVSILIGFEGDKNITETLISRLNISRLLAEQMVEELNSRVFQYVLDKIKEKITIPIQETEPIMEKKDDDLPITKMNNLPTLEDDNDLPMIQKDEKVRINPIPKEKEPEPVYKKGDSDNSFIKYRSIPTQSDPSPSLTNQMKEINPPESVQKPIPIPRLNIINMDENGNEEQPKKAESSVLENKEEKKIVEEKPNIEKKPEPTIKTEIEHKADPYREPIE